MLGGTRESVANVLARRQGQFPIFLLSPRHASQSKNSLRHQADPPPYAIKSVRKIEAGVVRNVSEGTDVVLQP